MDKSSARSIPERLSGELDTEDGLEQFKTVLDNGFFGHQSTQARISFIAVLGTGYFGHEQNELLSISASDDKPVVEIQSGQAVPLEGNEAGGLAGDGL